MKHFVPACLLLLIISCTKQPELKLTQPSIEGTYLCNDTFNKAELKSSDTPYVADITYGKTDRYIKVVYSGNNTYSVDQDVYQFNRPFSYSTSYRSPGGFSYDSIYIDGDFFYHRHGYLSGWNTYDQLITGKKVE